jgi:FkbM family methyltransferase
MSRFLSYAQRFEDIYLLRCFDGQDQGFYIDVGSGHPVVDNVSFAFYLRGWRGILVEPNPNLARLSLAVRPRDRVHPFLLGSTSGRAIYYLVEDFHGLSTMIPSNAEGAEREFSKRSEKIELPVVPLRELCAQYADLSVDFLKIDVEGAEQAVLEGGDFGRCRPKIVLVEALAPYTLTPSWTAWEHLLLSQGYRFAFFDGLNRYYVAEESATLIDRFPATPLQSDDIVQFGVLQPALIEERHPDMRLAKLVAKAALSRLPLLDRATMLELLTDEIADEHLERPATQADLSGAYDRIFGTAIPAPDLGAVRLPSAATVRDLYQALLDSDAFRVACGRISASYVW